MSTLAQYFMSGLMLAMIYALLALGFTLFFGVLDVIQFGHGDVFTFGAFAALVCYLALVGLGISQPVLLIAFMALGSIFILSIFGMLMAKGIIMPLKSAPPLNVLLATMMLGTALREGIRLFYPEGANPHKFPALLPAEKIMMGNFALRIDNCIMLVAGALTIVGVSILFNRTRIGLAMRAVALDEETAKTMGINYTLIVLVTFALGSSLAAIAAMVSGLYYHEISFSMGLMTGAIGFSAAIIGGLGNFYGAILGGVVIAFLQTLGAVAMPFSSAYKDVFMFAVVIVLITWRPTGLISERVSERV
ncbi:MAG: branched-chain amino acid ABC transporter permease [Bradyrhizobiaceae bacterium]|nr:MAG: branched-chain amino acid ABC transporter permease [Bradyrhizobiaceae bacterium]